MAKQCFGGVPYGTAGYDPPAQGRDGFEVRGCDRCGIGVWVGPRQQAAIDAKPDDSELLCPRCVVKLYGSDVSTTNLGG